MPTTPCQAPRKQRRNSSRVNLLISLTFHAAIVLALGFFAARHGLLGKELKKITVRMVKEKPPDKPKPKPKPKTSHPPKAQPPHQPAPKAAATPKTPPPKTGLSAPPPATATAPPAVAPPPALLPSFVFEGGKVVQTSSDPIQLYKGMVESALRARWNRPSDVDDSRFVATVELAVDRAGHLSDPTWQRHSGNARWDASVSAAIAATKTLGRPPPTHFPPRFLVRFDVQQTTEAVPP
jgi:TonB C terminal